MGVKAAVYGSQELLGSSILRAASTSSLPRPHQQSFQLTEPSAQSRPEPHRPGADTPK